MVQNAMSLSSNFDQIDFLEKEEDVSSPQQQTGLPASFCCNFMAFAILRFYFIYFSFHLTSRFLNFGFLFRIMSSLPVTEIKH